MLDSKALCCWSAHTAGELTGGPLDGVWGPRPVGRRPPGWDPRMPAAGWDRDHPGLPAHPMPPMHSSQMARPMSPFDSGPRGMPQDGSLGDGPRDWGQVGPNPCKDGDLQHHSAWKLNLWFKCP